MIQSRKDCTVAKWSMLRNVCRMLFDAGRSNIYVYGLTLLDLDDIAKLRDEYEREKILERKKQYDEEQLCGDNE